MPCYHLVEERQISMLIQQLARRKVCFELGKCGKVPGTSMGGEAVR
jgi:hypothetical protein